MDELTPILPPGAIAARWLVWWTFPIGVQAVCGVHVIGWLS